MASAVECSVVKRAHGFIAGLTSSWITTLITVVYGLVSVPLVLHYLPIQEFGLFMLLLQIAGYFTLIELGMAGATARILMDHKDTLDDKIYGSVIATGALVFVIQGALILLVGLVAAPWIVAAAGVPPELREVAIYLLHWLALAFGLTTGFKVFSSVLYANKRLDVLNLATATSVIFGLAGLALVLATGGGLKDLAGVFVLQTLLSIVAQGFSCWRLRLLPQEGLWGRPTVARFREMFNFAKDVFLVNVGNQILEASQLIIVSRTMGLSAAAVWSVATKVFNLLYQLLTRIEGTAIVFFSEMMVRNEREKLKSRFRQIYQISASLAAVSLTFAVAINGPFVSLWAEPGLAWSMPLSASLASVVFLSVVTRCNVDLILHSKQLQALRYIYFLEAILFVVMALLMASVMGFYGVILAAFIGVFAVRFLYTSVRVAHYFQIPKSEILWSWLRRPLISALALAPFVILSPLILTNMASEGLRLMVVVFWVGLPSVLLWALIALPPDIEIEFRRFLPAQIVSFFVRIGGS